MAYAECGFVKYIVKGSVKSRHDLRAIEGVKIFIFFNDQEYTYPAGYEKNYPDFYSTSNKGIYEAIAYFYAVEKNSFIHSFIGGQTCIVKPALVEILVFKEGYLAVRKRFTEKDIRILEEKNEKVILLLEIYLENASR